jgi:hypothetical protein
MISGRNYPSSPPPGAPDVGPLLDVSRLGMFPLYLAKDPYPPARPLVKYMQPEGSIYVEPITGYSVQVRRTDRSGDRG